MCGLQTQRADFPREKPTPVAAGAPHIPGVRAFLPEVKGFWW
jgi:hypothetical protein